MPSRILKIYIVSYKYWPKQVTDRSKVACGCYCLWLLLLVAVIACGCYWKWLLLEVANIAWGCYYLWMTF